MSVEITVSEDVKEGDAVEFIADAQGNLTAVPKRKAKTMTGPKWEPKEPKN